MNNVPGIWNEAQIQQWKTITDAVHARGSYIFCQLWALGRAAQPEVLAKDGYEVISSGNIPMTEDSIAPRPLSREEIQSWVEDYATAARNAIAAGFDGVEIHGANGYLCDQFLQDTCNNRDDEWGGSVENRSRFGLEVAKAVSAAVGSDRTGYRISPWSTFQEMRMQDLQTQFTHLVGQLRPLGLAYLHVVEPRISGSATVEGDQEDHEFLLKAYGSDRPIILAGGFSADSAERMIQAYSSYKIAIGFGRHFIANPDLPFRLAKGIPLRDYDRTTFYTPKSPIGYVDLPFSEEFAAHSATQQPALG
jgi:NADPH2 dehydrogenase